jgi:putative oxidoreductase
MDMLTPSTPSSKPASKPASIPLPTTPGRAARLSRPLGLVVGLFERIPYSLIALLARLSAGATFWISGQTKVQGFVVNLITGEIHLGWPRLSDSVVALFRDEYRLPLVPPEFSAPMAATAEHLLPLLLVLGLGTRFAALGLLGMTAVIEVFVYPDAYPTHGVWATALLLLVARGAGLVSLDALLARRWARA